MEENRSIIKDAVYFSKHDELIEIMGKTADLTVVQKTIIDTLHKEGKPQTCIAKEAGYL